MENSKTLDELVRRLDFVENLYDAIRLVDPVRKVVHSYLKSDSRLAQFSSHACFNFWDRSSVCENCISMRAYIQNRTLVKIEYKSSRIYLVTATPVNHDSDTTQVIELAKDITDSGIINVEGLADAELQDLVGRRNREIIKDALTRIYNERFIFERLPHDILQSFEKGISIALLVVRISNIESIIDSYGSTIGEQVIKQIARIINAVPNKNSDWASRYEKTDFLLVLHYSDLNKVNRVGKCIRRKISRLEFDSELKNTDIELNMRYYILKNEKLTPDQFIAHATKMLASGSLSGVKNKPEKQYDKLFEKYLLTPREREVALLLVEGNSNLEITKKIFVGLSTVKKHISSILVKTNLKSRTEFVARLNENKP